MDYLGIILYYFLNGAMVYVMAGLDGEWGWVNFIFWPKFIWEEGVVPVMRVLRG